MAQDKVKHTKGKTSQHTTALKAKSALKACAGRRAALNRTLSRQELGKSPGILPCCCMKWKLWNQSKLGPPAVSLYHCCCTPYRSYTQPWPKDFSMVCLTSLQTTLPPAVQRKKVGTSKLLPPHAPAAAGSGSGVCERHTGVRHGEHVVRVVADHGLRHGGLLRLQQLLVQRGQDGQHLALGAPHQHLGQRPHAVEGLKVSHQALDLPARLGAQLHVARHHHAPPCGQVGGPVRVLGGVQQPEYSRVPGPQPRTLRPQQRLKRRRSCQQLLGVVRPCHEGQQRHELAVAGLRARRLKHGRLLRPVQRDLAPPGLWLGCSRGFLQRLQPADDGPHNGSAHVSVLACRGCSGGCSWLLRAPLRLGGSVGLGSSRHAMHHSVHNCCRAGEELGGCLPQG
mmetsp:Transcript_20783/g.52816  ORF Transcript_20783/g.52816 Transcript_20783/m.52816 type:complete len:396 (-) Transcript_20783:260-1447(-)